MKKYISGLFSLLMIFITLLNINNNFNNKFFFNKIFNQNQYYREDKNQKLNIDYDLKPVEYQLVDNNSDLMTELISIKGNTDNCQVVKTKTQSVSENSALKLKLIFNPHTINLSKSYYISGYIDSKTSNFYQKGSHINILNNVIVINDGGIYHLHLEDINTNVYDNYLELGENNWLLITKINQNQLDTLAKKLNVNFELEHNTYIEEFAMWLHHYYFDIDHEIFKSIEYFDKGFTIYIDLFSNFYKSFLNKILDVIDYDNSHDERINFKKLYNLVIDLANKKLQAAINEAVNNVNMHKFSLHQLMNDKKLPNNAAEIKNFQDNKSFQQWLQEVADSKFYLWCLNIKITILILMVAIFIIFAVFLIIYRYWNIYQPRTLKKIKINKEKMQNFKNDRVFDYISQFIMLNTKKNKSCLTKKYCFNSFFFIKEIFKNNLDNINYHNYDNVFYNEKTKSMLTGKQLINIILKSDNIMEYHQKIRKNYPNLDLNKFRSNIFYDILNYYVNENKNISILLAESDFDSSTKLQLAKIRSFLNYREWNYYFFELQNLSHKIIINFLDWKNKPLNYISYHKVLKKKLQEILQSEIVIEEYLQIIQEINFYRNLLSKVSPVKQIKLKEWNSMSSQLQDQVAWNLYFSLIKFLKFVNNHRDNKISV